MKRRPALVIEHFDVRMIVRFEGKDLRYRKIQEQERPQIAPRKPSSALPVKKVRYILRPTIRGEGSASDLKAPLSRESK